MKSPSAVIRELIFCSTTPPYPVSIPVFRRVNGQFFVVDAGSLNGTYVNRQRVDRASLKNGDEIMIGKFRLVFFTKSAIICQ